MSKRLPCWAAFGRATSERLFSGQCMCQALSVSSAMADGRANSKEDDALPAAAAAVRGADVEAAAAAALDRDAEHLGLAGRLLRHQGADLGRRPLGERDDGRLGVLDGCHGLSVPGHPAVGTSGFPHEFVTAITRFGAPIAVDFVAAPSILLASRPDAVWTGGERVCSTTGCRSRSTGSSPWRSRRR